MPEEVRYKAEFSPERWVGDDAIAVSPPGPTIWECTAFLLNPPSWVRERSAPEIIAQINRAMDRRAVDIDDILHTDPAAPPWVKAWAGPFTITVSPLVDESEETGLDDQHRNVKMVVERMRDEDKVQVLIRLAWAAFGEADSLGDVALLRDRIPGRREMRDMVEILRGELWPAAVLSAVSGPAREVGWIVERDPIGPYASGPNSIDLSRELAHVFDKLEDANAWKVGEGRPWGVERSTYHVVAVDRETREPIVAPPAKPVFAAIGIRDRRGSRRFFASLQSAAPLLHSYLVRDRHVVIEASLWGQLASLPGFGEGDLAALINFGGHGKAWQRVVSGQHAVFPTLG